MLRIYRYNVMQSIFTALKFPCNTYSFLPDAPAQALGTTNPFTVSVVLPFPERHVVGIIGYAAFSDWLPSLSNAHLRFLPLFLWLGTSF